jgi:hypothetical protein
MATTFEQYLDGLTGQQMRALALKFWSDFGGREGAADNFEQYRAGNLRLKLEEIIRVIIGKNVRVVIPEGFVFGHTDPNPRYYWRQPIGTFDFASLVARGARFFPQGMKMPSAAQVEDGCRKIEEEIVADPQVSNLFTVNDPRRGIRLPWFLPQMEIDPMNPGEAIHKLLKPVIKAAYEDTFPNRKFVDHRESNTDGQVTVVDESQLKLITALRNGPVFGWIFPAVFQGIGIEGNRALMKTLPAAHNFVLGGFDSLAAMILHPAILARDVNTPAMDLASFFFAGSQVLALHGRVRRQARVREREH